MVDYRWLRREVWRDGCFACKVDSATLLHGVADYRLPLNAETPSIFEGVSAFRGDGVIRMIQMIGFTEEGCRLQINME
jgi:hypothetical protein